MRTISAPTLAILSNKLGNEPISVIEILWDDVSGWFYSDRNITETDLSGYTAVPGVPPKLLVAGKILSLGGLDSLVDLTGHKSSAEISVVLDDTDGSLKTFMDTYDIHLKKVRLWQFFPGMSAFSEKFLVFSGHVASPVSWDARERTLSFNALSKLEDQEVGFSAETGQFMYLPSDLVGKAWPMVFGTVLTYPALQINHAVQGILGTGVGICTTGDQELWALNNSTVVAHNVSPPPDIREITLHLNFLRYCEFEYDTAAGAVGPWRTKANELHQQVQDLEEQRNNTIIAWNLQEACRVAKETAARNRAQCETDLKIAYQNGYIDTGNGPDVITVIGGEDFPQNQVITLDINGGLFTGVMQGTEFTITLRQNISAEDAIAKAEAEKFTQACAAYETVADEFCEDITQPPCQKFDYAMEVPNGARTGLITHREYGWICPAPPQHDITNGSFKGTNQSSEGSQLWCDAGSTVTLHGAESMYHVASIVPGTVLDIKAYRAGAREVRTLISVPTSYYTVVNKVYGPITARMIVLTQPLSKYTEYDYEGNPVGLGWEDTLYVTYQSTIGPNIVDIVKYLIDTYTTLTYDATSFAACRIQLAKFPANFPILDKKNIVQLLEEIAYQSRCAITLKDGVFYMKYLAVEPTSDDTITESDIDFEKGVIVEYTTTEDLITRMNCTWHLHWGERGGQFEFILRHNIKKYGIKDDSYDYYMYNQPDIVYKIATFWLIRRSNTWKKVKFSTFLNKLNLEPFDTVTLNFGSRTYVSTSPTKAIVEKATYNSDTNTIDFECLVPIKSGEMTPYSFFWPASLAQGTTFPTAREIAEGWAGGNSIGEDAVGDLPIGYTPAQGGSIIIGGINVGFGPHSDWGDSSPMDTGFTAQPVASTITFSTISATPRPAINLRLPALPQTHIILPNYFDSKRPDLPIGQAVLFLDDLIYDTADNDPAPLRTFFRSVKDEKLVGNTEAVWADAAREDSPQVFDFKYDEDGEQFGAGTAFLKED